MVFRKLLLAIGFSLVVLTVGAAEPEEKPSIVEDFTSDSVNIIIQDDDIARVLEYGSLEKKQEKRVGNIGYRVQVFSDNNVRTARNEARLKQRNIRARFPQYESYVTYNQPYWRLRVGDFRTQEEAAAFMAQLRKAFPAYAREMRVVRDKIRIQKD